MDMSRALRRIIHTLAAFGTVYYLVPGQVVPGLPKNEALILLLMAILSFEAIRLHLKLRIVGLRPYEYSRLSSFSWAFMGICVVVLFFPFSIALPVLLGVALMDPLAGELRFLGHNKLANIIWPISFIMFAALLVIHYSPPVLPVSMGFAGATISWLSEKMKFKSIDDDFLMSVLPAAAMFLIYAAMK